MPTVFRFAGLRVVIYSNDHRPAHVHVIGNGNEAVFLLQCPMGPPELRENFGFTPPGLNRMLAVLMENTGSLCAAWSEIHGN